MTRKICHSGGNFLAAYYLVGLSLTAMVITPTTAIIHKFFNEQRTTNNEQRATNKDMVYYFITGTSKGIGKALTEKILEAENTFVYGISRNVTVQHPRYHHQPLDLSDITALRNNLYKLFPNLPDAEQVVLVNNAGIVGEIGYVGALSTDNFEFVFNVNVNAPAILMNDFISAYSDLTCPKLIINISSGAGQRPIDGWSAYCASKAALDMLSQTCQQEQDLTGSGFKVYALSPGVVDTAMQQHIRQASTGQFSSRQRFVDLHAREELLPPATVASRILQLVKNYRQYPQVLLRIDALENQQG
jgi:benzil reductase ((S)-benzoin forming)